MSVITKVTYTADGTTQIYSVPFQYLSQSHAHVYLDGVETTNFTWNNTSAIRLNSVPTSGTKITIERITPYDASAISWQDGSILFAADMNSQDMQALYITQEAKYLSELSTSDASSAKTTAQSAYNAVTNASIQVGTVTSGTTPSIIKRGTGLNPIFDFVLVPGDKGAKGDTGASVTAATVNADGELIITVG